LRPPKGKVCHIGCELTPFFTGGTPDTVWRLPVTFADLERGAVIEPKNISKVAGVVRTSVVGGIVVT